LEECPQPLQVATPVWMPIWCWMLWSSRFADSQNLLERMAKEAIQDFQAGRVQPIDQLQ
jgi:hypothetical protein